MSDVLGLHCDADFESIALLHFSNPVGMTFVFRAGWKIVATFLHTIGGDATELEAVMSRGEPTGMGVKSNKLMMHVGKHA
jgi:hypothetical protein